MNRIRSLVRPTVTWALVAATIGLAFFWAVSGSDSAKEAAAFVIGPTTMVLRDWFSSRESK